MKKLYSYKCQICEIALPIPKGFVSEGAHIRALGKPHNGPDIVEYVLCLCPNHHSLLDLGGIYINNDFEVRDLKGLHIGIVGLDKSHKVDPIYTEYHRRLWGH